MANLLTKAGFGVVLLTAVLYQLILHDVVFNLFGYGRAVQPLSDFPAYRCHRIEDDAMLHACEDMWLHEPSRQLFLACSDSASRRLWMPK